MNAKLTLSVEKNIIKAAKTYAKKQGRSLSNIVEEYLKSIATDSKIEKSENYHPIVEELYGSINIADEKTYDQVLMEALVEKYGKR